MNDIDLSYFAGMIDGEGTISMYRRKENRVKSGYSFSPNFGISGNNKGHLLYLQDIFGGTICYPVAKKRIKSIKRPVFGLYWSSNQIRELLPKVLPYLVLKKKEAILLLDALEITKDHRTKHYQNSKLNIIIKELKSLKSKRNVIRKEK